MARKILEDTKEVQTRKRKQKGSEDDIYKFDFGTTEEQENIVKNPPKSKRGRKKKEEKKFEFDDASKNEMIASIDLMRQKIEQGQKFINELAETKNGKGITAELNVEELNESEEFQDRATRKRKNIKEKEEKDTSIFADILKKETKTRKRRTKKVEESKNIDEGIKINAKDGVTDVFLDENQYRIEMQKTEYNIYTKNSGASYIIVRDNELRIISGNVYLLLNKENQDYEIITNQDFKINYVIDNLERKDNVVNFRLTNLTEIIANEDGLVFVIDEEKVIENTLEDNHTLVISEEDGKVYLPYSKEEIKSEVLQNKGTKISDLIEEKYICPLDKYKNAIRARFREGYNLMYKKEGKSRRSAILLGIELMFETNLHPAVISACKNLEELDIYLDCLEDNELEKFSCFKIIYKSLPMLHKKNKVQEF